LRAEHVEFLVEEPSMEAALRMIVPRVIGDVSFEVYPFQCKNDLLSNLARRLQGYSAWLPDNYRIVVVVDRDDDDCNQLKNRLERTASSVGLSTRAHPRGRVYQVVNRVVIEELEAWFFGDWEAVCEAYPGVSRNVPYKRGFRDPDSIPGGTWEALERHLQRAGYFDSGLRKIEVARSIAQRMQPGRNRSRSFQVFQAALAEMVS
jgi:hypothetical protein